MDKASGENVLTLALMLTPEVPAVASALGGREHQDHDTQHTEVDSTPRTGERRRRDSQDQPGKDKKKRRVVNRYNDLSQALNNLRR